MGDSEIRSETRLEGIPLWLFVIFCSLALLGIIYTTIILIFNITKAKTKVVKMTSPNINIVILIAVIIGYGNIAMFGLDTSLVNESTMEKLQRCTAFTISICFTVIYGALFAKSWRVFLVFKNLNFNGKLTRDEHLLVGVLVMIVLDLVILLPWLFVDPIKCERTTISTKVQEDKEIVYEIDECRSKWQELWISLLYFCKIVLTLAGLYFTWQTRHVTLPSLRDSKQTYVVVFTVISCGFIALPSLLVPNVGMHIRFATGALVIWIVLTTTLTLLFMPKMILERKTRATSENASAFNFLFSESMRKTQEAIRKCSLCFCCDATEADRYGQEMLASEIDTLKGTIKQKDATIRELNDRLYIGTEKFHEYLTSPMKQNRSVLQAMQDKHLSRAQETPNSDDSNILTTLQRQAKLSKTANDTGVEDEGIHSCESYQHSSEEHSPNANTLPICSDLPSQAIHTVSNGHITRAVNNSTPSMRSYTRSSFSSQRSVRSFYDRYNGEPWRPPTPSEDNYHQSATLPRFNNQREISVPRLGLNRQNPTYNYSAHDLRSGLSTWVQNRGDNSYRYSGRSLPDRRSYHEQRVSQNHLQSSQQFSQIDLGAMEHDAMTHPPHAPSGVQRRYYAPADDNYASDVYRSSRSMIMSVSQI